MSHADNDGYTAEKLIALLHLQGHPEGGWYAFRESSGQVIPANTLVGFDVGRDTVSFIYYLLRRGEISRWHQLRATEIWTWHAGGSLVTTLGGASSLPIAGRELRLGPRLESGEQFQVMVPAGQWQTTRVVEGDFVLASCVVAPAFHDDECVLPSKPLLNEIAG